MKAFEGAVCTLHSDFHLTAGSSNSRTSPFEGEDGGASPSPAASLSPLAQNQSGSLTNCGRWRVANTGYHLPRCIISSAPVSDTGGPGAIPGEAANPDTNQNPSQLNNEGRFG